MTAAGTAEALDMRMRVARGEVVRPLTGRDVAAAVREGLDTGRPVSLDLSGLTRVVVDPRRRTARVQAGVGLAGLAAAAALWRLALVGRELVAAQVVRPDGELVEADAELLRRIHAGEPVGIVVDATYRLQAELGGEGVRDLPRGARPLP